MSKKKADSWKTAAILTIRDADRMSVRGRTEIAEWLFRAAQDLIQLGGQYSGRFTARYLYPVKKVKR